MGHDWPATTNRDHYTPKMDRVYTMDCLIITPDAGDIEDGGDAVKAWLEEMAKRGRVREFRDEEVLDDGVVRDSPAPGMVLGDLRARQRRRLKAKIVDALKIMGGG